MHWLFPHLMIDNVCIRINFWTLFKLRIYKGKHKRSIDVCFLLSLEWWHLNEGMNENTRRNRGIRWENGIHCMRNVFFGLKNVGVSNFVHRDPEFGPKIVFRIKICSKGSRIWSKNRFSCPINLKKKKIPIEVVFV